MIHVGVFSTVGYSNNKRFSPTVLNTPHGTHDVPHVHHDTPTVLNIPTVLKITPTVLMISPAVLNTPRYSRYPHIYHNSPTVLKISPTVLKISPTVLPHSQGEYSAFQWFADKSKRGKPFVSRGKSDINIQRTMKLLFLHGISIAGFWNCESLKPGSVLFPGVFPSFLYAGWQKSMDR